MNAVVDGDLADLLSLLGTDVAQLVRPHLTGDAAELLEVLDRAELRTLSPKKRERLLGEFERFLQFVLINQPSAAEHTEDHSAEEELPTPEEVAILDPREVLNNVAPEKFAVGVMGEHPRTIAAAVDCLSPERVAVLLAVLPDHIKSEVVLEFSKGMNLNSEVQLKLVESLVHKIAHLPDDPPRNDNHLKRLAEVIRAADKSQRRILIKAIEDHDPDTAEQLTDLMYVFDDIVELDDRAVQQILGQVDVSTLSAALSGASDAISDKIFRNLSRRAADMLKEELQFAGRVAGSKVTYARSVIVKLLAKAEQEAE